MGVRSWLFRLVKTWVFTHTLFCRSRFRSIYTWLFGENLTTKVTCEGIFQRCSKTLLQSIRSVEEMQRRYFVAGCFPRVFCMKPRPFIRLFVDRCVMTSPENARDISGKALIKYREVSKVTTLVTFGFSTTSAASPAAHAWQHTSVLAILDSDPLKVAKRLLNPTSSPGRFPLALEVEKSALGTRLDLAAFSLLSEGRYLG